MKLIKVKKEDAIDTTRLFNSTFNLLDRVVKSVRPGGLMDKNVQEVIGPGASKDMKVIKQHIDRAYTVLEKLKKEYDMNL